MIDSLMEHATRVYTSLDDLFHVHQKAQHFYEGQRSMMLELSTSNVTCREPLGMCSPGEICVHCNTEDRKCFNFTLNLSSDYLCSPVLG